MSTSREYEIHSLITDVWFDIDHNAGRSVHDHFSAGGTLTFDRRTFRGRDEIRQVYLDRAARGPRLSRHMVGNIHIAWTGDARARVQSILCLFAADGFAPSPLVTPTTVADVTDDIRRDRDRWLIDQRIVQTLFIGTDTRLAVPTE